MATPATPVESQYVDFGRAFQFFFEDPEWQKKTLMGSLIVLLSLILVGIPFLVGYGMAVLRRTARGEARPLPEWDGYGKYFMDGLQVIGLYLVYFIGAMLIPGAVGCLAAIVGGAAGDNGGGVAGMGIMFAYLLMFIFILPLAVYFPAAFWALCMGMWAMGEVVRRDPVLGGQTGYAQVFA